MRFWRTPEFAKRFPSAPRRRRSGGGKLRQRKIPVIETLEVRNLLSFAAPISYDVGSMPTAVVVADVNGDQIPDLVVANSPSGNPGSVSVLLGNGNGSFQAVHNFAVGTNPVAVAVGDFNGDAIPDLAIANAASNNVSILLGTGDGSFGAARNFAAGSKPNSLVVADFNGDGILDLVVVNVGTGASDSSVSLLLGNGDGSFQAPQNLAAGAKPVAVAAADLNGDGILDLAVTVAGGVSVLLGHGDGSFQSAGTFDTGGSPGQVVVGDFNGDGVPDLAVANNSMSMSSTVSILLGNGDGTFQIPLTSYLNIFQPLALAVGDFNGDGLADLAVVPQGGFGSSSDQVNILRGRGNGFFQSSDIHPAGGSSQAIAAADLNGDGVLDLVIVSSDNLFFRNTGSVSPVLGNGDGSFQFAPANPDLNGPKVVGDFNGDGIPDLAVANFFGSSVGVLLGNGDGTFRTAGNFPAGSQPGAMVVGDFNGDGIPDLAVIDANGVDVLLGRGNGIFNRPLPITIGNSPAALAAGDLNRDGILDLAVVTTNGVDVLLGNGDGTFQSPSILADSNSPRDVVVGDFNGDGFPDLAVANGFGSGGASLFLGNGNGTFQAPRLLNVGAASSLAVADLNGDGFPDLVVNISTFGGFNNGFSALLGNGDGTFQPAKTVNSPRSLGALAIEDFNGDGIPDLVTTESGTDQVRVWLGNGDGTFQVPPFGYLGAGNGLAVADLNGDGFPDVIAGSSILLNAADWAGAGGHPSATRSSIHGRGANPAIAARQRRSLAHSEAIALDLAMPLRTGAAVHANAAAPRWAATEVDRFFAMDSGGARSDSRGGWSAESRAVAHHASRQSTQALDLFIGESLLDL